VDRDREEEPGKILHEFRYGELANLKLIPHTPYYGTVDATPLFLVCVVEMMDWLNDRDLFVELLPTILDALTWIDRYGDADQDGFVEYAERAKGGVRNQGWKDSSDSLLYRDGRPAELPAALVEVQGYVYQAKVGLSRLLERMGQLPLAERLAREAAELRRRFELKFWLDAEQFYAQALDRSKTPITSITSNPAHCLWGGLCDPERAEILRDRLMAPDMFSGWGIRTLSSTSPHYNPMSYHNGTVWPHDNSIAVAGLRRYRAHRRGRQSDRWHHGGRRSHAQLPLAGIVLRLPARRPIQQRPGGIPRLLQPAGVGRRGSLPPDAGRAWHRARHHGGTHLPQSHPVWPGETCRGPRHARRQRHAVLCGRLQRRPAAGRHPREAR